MDETQSNRSGKVVNGMQDPAVKKMLDLINRNVEIKRDYDTKNIAIASLFEEGFNIATPSGAMKVTAQMLQQAMWRTMNKMKPLDFQLHGVGRPEAIEKIMTYGTSFIADKSGLISGVRDKGGVFWNQLLYGDGFYTFGSNPEENSDIPIVFNPIPNSNVYVDPYATSIRAGGYGRSATEALAVFSMSWQQAIRLYPKLKKNGTSGTIPREMDSHIEAETGRSYQQTTRLDDLTEIGYYYNLDTKEYVIVGGSACTVIDKVTGDKYPFMKDNKPYIPIGQFMCMPSSRGFFNYGLGNLLYRFALLNRKLMNMAYGHAEDSVYPVTLVNVPQGQASAFFNSLREAIKGRSQGKKPLIPLEYDPSNPGSGRVQAQSLLTQSALNEYQFLYDQMSREIRRLGINLDDIEKGSDVTATQIIAEEENSNAFVKQIMEYNASEFQFALEILLDMSKKFISKKNKTVINMPVKIDTGEKMMRMDQFTLGDYTDELNKHKYFIKVNSRSGAIPSNIMRQAQISRVLPLLPPGSPQYLSLVQRIAELNDTEIDTSSFRPPAPPALPSPQAGGELSESILPSETDVLEINSRTRKNPVAAF